MASSETIRDARGRAYDTLGERFDEVMNRYDLVRRIELVLARVPKRDDVRVLEVGCGLGYLSDALRRERGLRPISLDIAVSLLGIGRGAGRLDRAVGGSALALPFPSHRFDLVVSTECIEHTPDPRGAVREMARMLRPGGTLVLTCPNARWHWSVWLADALRLRPYEGYENWPGFAELRRWVEAEGITVAEHLGFHALPFQLPLAPRWLRHLDDLVLGAAPSFGINQLIVGHATE